MPRRNGLSRRLATALVVFAVSTAPCVFAVGVAATDPPLMPARFTRIVTDDGRLNAAPQRGHSDADKSCAPAQCPTDFGSAGSKVRRLTAVSPDSAAGQ